MGEHIKQAARRLIAIASDVADAIVKGIPLTSGDAETIWHAVDDLESETNDDGGPTPADVH